VDSLRDLGIDAQGIDVDNRVHGHPYLKCQSMFDLDDSQYDLVICMEVAEHIDQKLEDQVVDRVAAAVGKTLIWTAALPGQGGTGHINCRPREYWAVKLAARGLVRDINREQALIDYARAGYHMGWFANNLLFFQRPE
jgi:hypothetical protein